jgi:hypothetical protein
VCRRHWSLEHYLRNRTISTGHGKAISKEVVNHMKSNSKTTRTISKCTEFHGISEGWQMRGI